jgi:outer membrane protein OmpA-like peptidoglycan-associated protein
LTAVPELATRCLDFAPVLRHSPAMHTKKIAVPLLLLSLAACQTTPYQRPLPPPPPASPVQPAPHAAERATRPRPPRVAALPSYNKPTAPFAAADAGRYMDAMEHDLRRILHGVPVGRVGDTLVVNFRSDAVFDSGGGLSPSGRNTFQVLAVALRHYDHTRVEISGFTDTRRAADESVKVSQKYADTVASALKADGVEGGRISAAGLGATHLKIATGEGMNEARNRRVEIRIAPRPG